MMARPTKKQRIYANKKNLRGCVKAFLDGLDALELTEEMGEQFSKKQIKQWGEKQVHQMAVELDKKTDPNGPFKQSETEATAELLKRFEENHAEWFKGEKEKLIVHYVRLNDLFALLERQDYNIKDFISAVFGSMRHHTGRINKGSIAEMEKITFGIMKKPYDEGIENVAIKYKLKPQEVLNYLAEAEKIKMVRDAYEAETTIAPKGASLEARVAIDVAQVYRELNDNILKTFRKYGVIIPDLKNYYFTAQVHDAVKMKVVNRDLMNEVMGLSAESFDKMSGIKKADLSKILWKKFTTSLIDWDKSFLELETGTAAQRDKVLEEMYNDIIQDTSTGKRPGEMVSRDYYSFVKGKRRQIFWKDSDSYVKYQTYYGTPNLINHTEQLIKKSSKNLAVFSVLGPKPEEVFSKIKQRLIEKNPAIMERDYHKIIPQKIRKKIDEALPKFTSDAIVDMQNWFDHFTKHVGSSPDATVSRISLMLKFGPAVRVMRNLGMNSLPDLMLLRGVAQNLKSGTASSRVLKTAGEYFLRSNEKENNETRKLLGRINTNLSNEAMYQALGADVEAGVKGAKIRKLAHYLNEKGGIHRFDELLKSTVHMTYSQNVAENLGKALKDVPEELYYKLHAHQILPEEWEGIGKFKKAVIEKNGEKYFVPFEIGKMTDKEIGDIYGVKTTSKKTIDLRRHDLAVKMHSFLMYQSEYVIPELNAPADRALQGIMRSGGIAKVPGAQTVLHLVWQFKNWMSNFTFTVLRRIWQQEHKTIQSQVWDMAQILVPLGASYTALNYWTALVQNRKFPGKKREALAVTLAKETLQNTVDQLGLLKLLADQFTNHPRSAAAALSFYGHLGADIKGIVSPSQRLTRGDYLSRLLGEFANITVPTSALYNHFASKLFESHNQIREHRLH